MGITGCLPVCAAYWRGCVEKYEQYTAAPDRKYTAAEGRMYVVWRYGSVPNGYGGRKAL